MADIKISQLGAAAEIADADVIPATVDGVTVKVPVSVLKEHIIGDTNISSIGDGTPTGAINVLSNSKTDKSDIATVETAVASKAYSEGEELYYNGLLYKAIAAIASGATLTVGTNINLADKVTDQIVSVKNALAAEVTNRQSGDSDLNTALTNLSNKVGDINYNNAGSHNAIYRGKKLGTAVSAAQYAKISDGSFEDMYIGDYWEINSVVWRIAAFDYWLNNAGSLSTHHVVIVPDTNLTSCKMNNTNITTGGYVGSDFYTGQNDNTGRATAIAAVNSAFGSSHILTYKDYLINAVTDGHPSGQVWQDCTVELMNEAMVYGGKFFEPMANGAAVYSNYTVSKSQLPLFQHDHSRICNRANWWLRGVVSASFFALVNGAGYANGGTASNSFGVRPAFAIKA